jgi:hypothetical protein
MMQTNLQISSIKFSYRVLHLGGNLQRFQGGNNLRICNILSCVLACFKSLRMTGMIQLGHSELHYHAAMLDSPIRWTCHMQST